MRITICRAISIGHTSRKHATVSLETARTRSFHPFRPRPHKPRTSHQKPLRFVKAVEDQSRRNFFTDSLPSIFVPPAVFTSLLLTLWAYKCIMTVLFQDKIIYMPYMPPFARSEKMEDYTAVCKPVDWEQKQIKSLDGTKIALCLGTIPESRKDPEARTFRRRKHVVICYFQGNGSSPPPRLPLLSNVLKAIRSLEVGFEGETQYSLVALSYRGYWTSSGRASQRGIELDAQALLQWISATFSEPSSDLELILWGQSIGAGVASTAAARYLKEMSRAKTPITGIVLETPFSGIKSMLIELYPQKWLPYRYLWPFLWNHWDSIAALRTIAASDSRPQILILPATRDEVVPAGEADKLERLCHEVGLPTVRKDTIGALHTEATTRREGQDAVARFVLDVSKGKLA